MIETSLNVAGALSSIKTAEIELEVRWKRGLRLSRLKVRSTGTDWVPQLPAFA